jgi:hypothetical protein
MNVLELLIKILQSQDNISYLSYGHNELQWRNNIWVVIDKSSLRILIKTKDISKALLKLKE